MKKYLCVEDDEQFIIEATDMNDAREAAGVYGGYVIKELED